MPLNPNILALLRQTQTSGNAQPTDQGVNPNLEMILQAMGMMPRQMDMQGRPILSGVKNPSTMDQHYARQANPEAMKDRYSSPTFAMGPNDPNRMAPATKLPGQGQIVAHQPISGLPGQVGPAYGTQMTPISMSPSAEENDAMTAVRNQYRQTMQQGRGQTSLPTPSPTVYRKPLPPSTQYPPDQGPPIPNTQALQQFPMLGAFAPPIPQSVPSRVDTSPGTMFDMLRKKGQGVVSNAQSTFGSLAPQRPTPLVRGSVWEQLRRQGSFGR